MCIKLHENLSDDYDFIVTFANTGKENEKTLEFVDKLDRTFNWGVVWIEASVNFDSRKSTGHKIVSFETASRNGEPYHDVIKKYGISNPSYLHCTRELKRNPMQSYIRSTGIHHTKIPTAIGIREDEKRRISVEAEQLNLIYPLVDLFPTDKQDVKDFWSKQDFRLELDEWDGNCSGCFKKSFKKIFKQIDSDPKVLDFYKEMEEKYPQVGNKIGFPDRVFFRGNIAAKDLEKIYLDDRNSSDPSMRVEDGGCSESCEPY